MERQEFMSYGIITILIIGIIFISGCIQGESPLKTQTTPTTQQETQPQTSEKVSCTDECTSDSCDGLEFISCEKLSDGCKYKINKGKVIGKCGVECLSDTDCLSNEECIEYKCQTSEKETGPGFSRNNPLSLNTAGEITMGYKWDQLADIKITVTGIMRGDSAWSMLKEANMFNDEPGPGKEYLLAKIKLEVISTSDNKAYEINSHYFEAVSSSGIVYDSPWVVEPEPKFDGEVYPGGTLEGWQAFEVNKDDSKPLLRVSGANDVELWIKLY